MEQTTTIFLGPQGCGKGTQIALLQAFLAKNDPDRTIVSFSAGTMLRAFAEKTGYTAERIKPKIARGALLPTFLSTCLFSEYLIDHMKGNEHLIADGFPRTEDQTYALDSAMQFYNRVQPTVLYVSISDEEALKRLTKRGRGDDTEDGIRKRLQWNREQSLPLNDWFKNNSMYRFIEVDGERPIEDIHKDILNKLGIA